MKTAIKIASKLQIKQVLFSAPMFLQFLYAIRDMWWGIGAYFFNFYFSLHYLDYLTSNPLSLAILFLGLTGLIGVLLGNYILNIIFAIFNVFLFAKISITFFTLDPTSVAGVNYTIETLGVIWLVFRIQWDKEREKRHKKLMGLINTEDKSENV